MLSFDKRDKLDSKKEKSWKVTGLWEKQQAGNQKAWFCL